MDNGCPKCELLDCDEICLDHQIEQAEQDRDVAIKKIEELKKEKEQENERSRLH